MKSAKAGFNTVDEYIDSFPVEIQKILEEIRANIKATVPGAEEKISYQMAAFQLKGIYFIHFAAWKKHIGFYPIPSGDEAFQKEIGSYKSAKSSLNFPINKPMPLNLIRKLVKFRVAETQIMQK
jgi:uncharacterized protein YdhG (YjbR/CyaY superfamily)